MGKRTICKNNQASEMVYSTSKYSKVFNPNFIDKGIRMNHEVLDFYEITERENAVLTDNLDEIVDYVANESGVKSEDNEKYARIIKIVYYEYLEDLSVIILSDMNFVDPSPVYRQRENKPLVRHIPLLSKFPVFNRYMKIYREYEKSFEK